MPATQGIPLTQELPLPRSGERRQEILAAAGELFRERGYHATSMRDLARALNLRGSSLYAHVSSKEEMLWEIVSTAATAFLEAAEAASVAADPRVRLSRLIAGHLQVMMSELPNAAVFFHEWRFLSLERRTAVVGARDRYEAHFRAAIQDGQAAGLFDVPDVRLAATFVLSALNWSYQWFDPEGPLAPAALNAHFQTLIFRALNAKPER